MSAVIGVQIVNYRTKRYLGRCLGSVLAALDAAGVEHRVSVVDNASGDDLSDLTEELSGRVEFVSADDNRGFGAAHNFLAARGATPLLCFVNPDVVAADRDMFARLLADLEDDAVAVAGPQLTSEAGEPQRWDHGELRGVRARIANAAGHAHWRPRSRPLDVAWVSGGFMLVRRSAFEAVGGFDEAYFLYKEDEDLCLRIRRAGGRVVYDPTVRAVHVGSVVAERDPDALRRSFEHYAAKNLPGGRRRVAEWLYLNVSRRI